MTHQFLFYFECCISNEFAKLSKAFHFPVALMMKTVDLDNRPYPKLRYCIAWYKHFMVRSTFELLKELPYK